MVSHFAASGVYAPRPGVVRASGGVFAVPGLGHGVSRAVGRWLDLGRTGALHSMVLIRHGAWQGASVTRLTSDSGVELCFQPAG